MRRLTLVLVGGLLATGPASAQASTGGGVYRSPPASISSIACTSQCLGARTAQAGSLVRLRGTEMQRVRQVIFLGGRGNRDDVVRRVTRATKRWVTVRVPPDALPGRLRTRNADGSKSRPSSQLLSLGSTAGSDDEELAPRVADRDTTDSLDAHVETNTVFYDAVRKATFRYVVTAPAPLEVAVELVRVADGTVVRRWSPGMVPPGVEQRVDWDGTAAGAVVPEGRYEFRVFAVTATAASSTGGGTEPPLVADSFRFLDHKFPVRGKHTYGEEAARYGAGRGGRAHQGQDVFAPCGTPLVAARGGVVRFKATQSRAGNYVVIDGDGTDDDYVYMHLQEPAIVNKGDRVATGQRIGAVGDTGVATGCHLHFEMWSGPGWYEGGSPFDPLPRLMAWDAASGRVATASSKRR